jgi:HEPN domain-containing protein
MKPAVKGWLELAEKDLKAAGLLIADPTLAAAACFHCQQCAEKCLKAVIESKGQNPPKSHDLIRLYGMIEEFVDLDEDVLARLNEIYIDSRYPPGVGLLPGGNPTSEDAKQLIGYANEIFRLVRESLH